MLCQKCNQNEAEVHFVQTVDGETTQMRLCAQCAAEKGIVMSPISFTSFLQGFMDASKVLEQCRQAEQSERAEAGCAFCGRSLSSLSKAGKAGCPQCYDAFKPQMASIIRSVQAGNTRHVGKIPQSAGHVRRIREIEEYKRQQAEAVCKEEFEQAADLRDKIRALEGGEMNEKMV